MTDKAYIGSWQLAWIENARLAELGLNITCSEDVSRLGLSSIAATVPGSFEIDFMREGILDDIYFGVNTTHTQRYENLHLYYYTSFEYQSKDGFDANLLFEGIDTAAEIFLDGKKLGFVENMLHAHRFSMSDISEGRHSLLVHIIPAAIYARSFDIPSMCFGLVYNHDGIMLRKPGYMFGWDIMPRVVSGGIWKPVCVEYLPKSRIVNPYTYTNSMYCKDGVNLAQLITTLKIESDADFITDFTVVIKGRCGESCFESKYRPFCASMRITTLVENPLLWWPKNYGEPLLYDVEIVLLQNGIECDRVTYKLGIRTLWLKRTSRSGDNGDFCFIVNGKRIFVMGTNWVPCDALPSRHDDYTLRNIEMVKDLGCNMIRCWGGNVYPSELLYDYCDKNGILIWQDFALACGHYTDDDRMCRLVKEEVKQVVIEKRQHPSLAIWAGDNECDVFVVPYWESHRSDEDQPSYLDPNKNMLTREVILREVRNHDAIRPYIPSSPYLDEIAWRYGMPAEDHLWGPRDFFKGDFYLNPECHFASEIGYHGCPSPKSIEKFIPRGSMPQHNIREICDNGDWLIHAAGVVPTVENNPYAYRLELMIQHVERIFGKASDDLDEFARQSQISQAEAKKYFIECFRAEKWRKTGILWWNVIDGWPQVSDAIVDWYGCKKLAYSYIKRSQQPFCMLCAEPKDGYIDLLAANDTQEKRTCEYKVTDMVSDRVIATGYLELEANGLTLAARLPELRSAFLLIEWKTEDGEGKNHFVTNIGEGWTYKQYEDCMKKCGFYLEYEGF